MSHAIASLTDPQRKLLQRIARMPLGIWVSGSARARVANTLHGRGLIAAMDRSPTLAVRYEVTEAGRKALADCSEVKAMTTGGRDDR